MNREEILELAIDLANETGVVPKRDDFCKLVSKHVINKIFGSFKDMLLEAGLLNKQIHAKKDILERKISDLKFNSSLNYPIMGPYKKVVAIGDLHCPFTCMEAFDQIIKIIEVVKPDYIVTLGDQYDFFSASKFPKQIIIKPQDEVDSAYKMLKEIFRRIHEASPNSKKYSLRGNHDIRPIKRLIESAPELMPFFDFDRFFDFPNFENIRDAREVLEIDGVVYTHGFLTSGLHMKKFMRPVVHGHLHRGGLRVDKIDGKWLFELDAGYVGNPSSVAFNYTPTKENRWTKGVGLITEFGPSFIPFEN